MSAVTRIEPIAPPDPRRPTRIPSLPAWLASQKNAMAVNLQIDPRTGSFQDLVTLPAHLMLRDDQRAEIETHIRSLRSLLDQTPANHEDFDKSTFAAVTKLLMVKPAAKTTEAAAEARGDAFMAALDDVPHWAVISAIRLWYRGECGKDERGKPYDYQWAPEPHALRRIALGETSPVLRRIRELEPLLIAVPFVDSSADLERGQAAMRGLHRAMHRNDDLGALTFDAAVKLGNEAPAVPAASQPAAPPTPPPEARDEAAA